MEIYLTKMVLNPQSRKVWHDLSNPQRLHRTISNAFPKIEGQEHLPHHEQDSPRQKYNLLHRLDFDAKEGRAILLVQSSIKPKTQNNEVDGASRSVLSEGYSIEWESKSVHDKYARIKSGMRLRFRLHANPTKRIGKSDAKAADLFKESPPEARYKETHGKHEKRRRVEIIGDESKTREQKLVEWLRRKGEVRLEKDERARKEGRDETIKMGGYIVVSASVKEGVPNVAAALRGKVQFTKNKIDKPVTLDAITFDGILEVTDTDAFRNSLVNGIGTGKAYGFGLLSIAPVRAD